MRWVVALAFLAGNAVPLLGGEDWPQWRGRRADGVSRDEGFPVHWSRDDNVSWRAPLAGRGASTPIVSGDLVLVTLQIGEGPMEMRLARDLVNESSWELDRSEASVEFRIEAYHRVDGRLSWSFRLDAPDELPPVYPTHNLASPSVVTDGKLVYAWFGTGQLVALDLEGELAWQRDLGVDFFPFRVTRGHASSPVLQGDTLWLLVDHEDEAMLLALDKTTGRRRFEIERGVDHRSYATPLVVAHDGQEQLVINGDTRIDAYDAGTGQLLWSAGEPVRLSAPTPVFHEGVIYTNRGYASSPYLAVRPGGEISWRVPTGGPYVSSMLYYDGALYMATENGIASAVDAASGERLWRERLGDAYSASPVAAEGHVYFLGESGETVVMAAGPTAKHVARNPLGERTLASPALSNGQIFVRTDEHLYAIGSPPAR